MTDYDTVLLRKIRETYDDPAKLREVVYEAARLALRWQVQEQGPRLGDLQSRRHLSELEDAIARVEAASSGPGATGKREPGKAAAGRLADQFSQSEEVDHHDAVHGQQAQDSSAELYGLEAVARVLGKSNDCERSKTSAALHESPHSAVVPVEFGEDAGEEPHSQVGNLQAGRHGDAAALGGRGSRESRRATEGSPGSRQRRREEILEGAPDLADEAHSQDGDRSGRMRLSGGAAPVREGGYCKADEAPADLPESRRDAKNATECETDDDHNANEEPVKPANVEAQSAFAGRPSRHSSQAAGRHRTTLRNRNVPDEPQEDEAPETHQEGHPQRQDTERPHGPGNAAGGRPEIHMLISNESDDAPEPNEVPHPRRLDDPILVEREDATGSRELVLVPDRPKRGVYLVNPSDFVNPDVSYRLPEPPRGRARMVVSGLVIAFQLAIAALAVAAFYVAMWGRDSPVQIAKETSAVGTPAPPGTIAEAAIAGALPFRLPNAYGVYALNDDQLIELEQIQATPVDPRTRSQLQITKPARVVIDATKLAFVVFRRELVSSAPDKVSVRIASRIAHSMIFDSTGKPEVTTPATDTWLIREKGYDLRVSPLRETPEMVMLRPENTDFLFPAGRYELMIGGQPYDFIIAGEVTDPAHCVEGVATGRGPVFYECKAPP